MSPLDQLRLCEPEPESRPELEPELGTPVTNPRTETSTNSIGAGRSLLQFAYQLLGLICSVTGWESTYKGGWPRIKDIRKATRTETELERSYKRDNDDG